MNKSAFRASCLPAIALFIMINLACGNNSTGPKQDTKSLAYQVEHLTTKYKIPGAVGIVCNSDSTKEIVASGVRKAGTDGKVETTDLFFIGSITKSMTATMIATLVEEGVLDWSTKPADVIPGLADSLDPGYSQVTLLDLLRHRGGAPGDEDFDSIPEFDGTLKEQRRKGAIYVMSQPPAVARGTYRYSNAGYVIAASMAESVTGTDWRMLMNNRLFGPLGINAFYGWPTESDANQPWGHEISNSHFMPVAPSADPQSIRYIEPAGFISMDISDLAVFMRLYIGAMSGHPQLLQQETYDTLLTPLDEYGCGMGIVETPSGTLLWHNGSNGYFYSLMYIVPGHDIATAIIVNAGGDDVVLPVHQAVETVTSAEIIGN